MILAQIMFSSTGVRSEQFAGTALRLRYCFELDDVILDRLKARAPNFPLLSIQAYDAHGLYASRDSVFKEAQRDLRWDASILLLRKGQVAGVPAVSQVRRGGQDLWLEIFFWPGPTHLNEGPTFYSVQLCLQDQVFDDTVRAALSGLEQSFRCSL